MESSPSRSVTQFSIYTYSNLIEILHSCHRMPSTGTQDTILELDHRFTDPRLADRQLEREFNR
eukprot:UN3051